LHKTPEITRLIHENFSILISFAFSRKTLSAIVQDKFKGEWKYLEKGLVQYAEARADRALLEMGTQLRILDDKEGLNDFYRARGDPSLGTVTQAGGDLTDLHFRI
jgi:hypothetical protein